LRIALGVAIFLTGCSGWSGDDAQLDPLLPIYDDLPSAGASSVAGSTPSAGMPSVVGGGGSTSGTGGAETGGAAGTGGTAPLLDAFEDAPAFVAAPVEQSARAQMTTSGINPSRTACVFCHDGKQASALLTGGTAFLDATARMPAVDFEVRVLDVGSGQAYTTHTDADGNFWIPAPLTPPTGPFRVGIRNGASSLTMPLEQLGLECNGSACHGGPQGPVRVTAM
jgi:hypothetical protein